MISDLATLQAKFIDQLASIHIISPAFRLPLQDGHWQYHQFNDSQLPVTS